MPAQLAIEDLILNYDPEHPQDRFREAGLAAALKSSTGRLPARFPGRTITRPSPCRSTRRRPRPTP